MLQTWDLYQQIALVILFNKNNSFFLIQFRFQVIDENVQYVTFFSSSSTVSNVNQGNDDVTNC